MAQVKLGSRWVGPGHPCYIVAEIGINHNGDVETAYELVRQAARAGVDAVKFQKRTPIVCVPESEWDKPKETPWGETLPYIEYRERMEFPRQVFWMISDLCRAHGVDWFASVWDRPSIDFMEQFDPICIKIPSAKITDEPLMHQAGTRWMPVMLSGGMSTQDEVDTTMGWLEEYGAYGTANGNGGVILLHCHSAYPAPNKELSLGVIRKWKERYPKAVIGYSGHEVGLATSVAAAVLGADVVERHITLNRAQKGSDHAASVEPQGFAKLVRDIRSVEEAMKFDEKRVWDSELPAREKLRG